MARYRSKVIEIEAFRWTGGPDQVEDPDWVIAAIKDGRVTFSGGFMFIATLEGRMRAEPGTWIVWGTEGELYPVKASVFERKYEPVGNVA